MEPNYEKFIGKNRREFPDNSNGMWAIVDSDDIIVAVYDNEQDYNRSDVVYDEEHDCYRYK